MVRICICDDTMEHLEAVQMLTQEYITINHIEAEIETFSHPDILLSALETKQFQLYLLDMVMPMANGINIGKTVRKNNPFVQIIYITSAPEYALDSFVANPIDYIIKPVEKVRLFGALEKAIQRIEVAPEKTILMKTKDSICTVAVSQIVYLEYTRHSVICVLVNGEKLQSITIKESFAEYTQSLMQNSRFVKPHSSFVVNMQYVERLNKDGFQMKGNYFIPISGKKYVEIRNQYLNFRLEV